MRIFTSNLEDLTTRRGLHRVWEAIREGGQAQLVARWIDPESEESRAYDNGEAIEGDEAGGPGLLVVCNSPKARLSFRWCRTMSAPVA
jgi:hypothetical protein